MSPKKQTKNPKKNQHPKTIVYIHFSNCSESLVLRTPFDVSYYGEQDRSNHPECTSLVYGQIWGVRVHTLFLMISNAALSASLSMFHVKIKQATL